jgi:hypothetical protein
VRAAVIMLNAHQGRLMMPSCRPLLIKLQACLRMCVQSTKNLMGFNLAGLHHVQALAKLRSSAPVAVAAKRTLVI